MAIRIEKLSPSQPKLEEKYETFLQSQGGLSPLFFVSNKYRKALQATIDAENHYFLALDGNSEIVGALPSFIYKRSKHGSVLNSLPFFGSHGGPIAKTADVATQLIDAFFNFAKEENCVSSTLITIPHAETDFMVPISSRFEFVDDRIGQWTNIQNKTEDELMEQFHYKTRNSIRKGFKGGFEIDSKGQPEAWNFLAETHTANMQAMSALPKPRKFFEQAQEIFRYGEDCKLWIARLNGKPVAALLLFYFNGIVEYFTPAVLEEYRSSQPLSALILEAMKDAAQSGKSQWNWGGTGKSQESLYRFKSRWGAVDVKYRYYTKILRDEVRDLPKETILTEYPYFFVLPFSLLRSQKNT